MVKGLLKKLKRLRSGSDAPTAQGDRTESRKTRDEKERKKQEARDERKRKKQEARDEKKRKEREARDSKARDSQGGLSQANGDGDREPPRPGFESPFSGDELLLVLDSCPLCGGNSRTLVSEYNRFVIFEGVDEAFVRYDYSLCHDCGVVYAATRPYGSRLKFLLGNFNEVLARVSVKTYDPLVGKPILYPGPLSEPQRDMIRARAAQGVFVSEHERRPKKEYLEGLLGDLLSNAPHIELLTALLELDGAKVLEIRPRTGAILNVLKQKHGAEVYALPIFESQQLIVAEVYGIPAVGLIDHDSCAIPYDTKFDLIVCNHQLTHCVHPQRLFEQLRNKLTSNGSIYLYNEVDDQEILTKGKNMFRVLNPFHMQTFDGPSLVRALAANQFRTVFLTHINEELACLARLDPEVEMEPIPHPELELRLVGYRQARDRAIVSANDRIKSRFETEWPTILSRALAEGVVVIDSRGRVVVSKNKATRPRSDGQASGRVVSQAETFPLRGLLPD